LQNLCLQSVESSNQDPDEKVRNAMYLCVSRQTTVAGAHRKVLDLSESYLDRLALNHASLDDRTWFVLIYGLRRLDGWSHFTAAERMQARRIVGKVRDLSTLLGPWSEAERLRVELTGSSVGLFGFGMYGHSFADRGASRAEWEAGSTALVQKAEEAAHHSNGVPGYETGDSGLPD
ncbi:MAG TPA: hypothetical protein VL588_03480, partial [Bdellovibrionota bacterium]|nr:hypothetical protein [Bdellovibrionota bacterium]